MRFKVKPEPKAGDTRQHTRFAILPIKLDNEYRWLETVTTLQKYIYYGYELCNASWIDIKFIDKESNKYDGEE